MAAHPLDPLFAIEQESIVIKVLDKKILDRSSSIYD